MPEEVDCEEWVAIIGAAVWAEETCELIGPRLWIVCGGDWL